MKINKLIDEAEKVGIEVTIAFHPDNQSMALCATIGENEFIQPLSKGLSEDKIGGLVQRFHDEILSQK